LSTPHILPDISQMATPNGVQLGHVKADFQSFPTRPISGNLDIKPMRYSLLKLTHVH